MTYAPHVPGSARPTTLISISTSRTSGAKLPGALDVALEHSPRLKRFLAIAPIVAATACMLSCCSALSTVEHVLTSGDISRALQAAATAAPSAEASVKALLSAWEAGDNDGFGAAVPCAVEALSNARDAVAAADKDAAALEVFDRVVSMLRVIAGSESCTQASTGTVAVTASALKLTPANKPDKLVLPMPLPLELYPGGKDLNNQ